MNMDNYQVITKLILIEYFIKNVYNNIIKQNIIIK